MRSGEESVPPQLSVKAEVTILGKFLFAPLHSDAIILVHGEQLSAVE